MMSLQQAKAWIPQSNIVGDPTTIFERVHTDTRSLRSGDMFVALRGEQFDGHAYVESACSAGAVAVMVDNQLSEAGVPRLVVSDTRLALGELAAGWRAQFVLPMIAVTGSNGKTTVTQMLASVLSAWKQEKSLSTKGNFNNDIGVPLTLLGLNENHEVAVVELGMNHPGEIGYLAQITKPTVALVNNAQREHLEFMHTVEAVAQENGSVITALPKNGVAVFPANDSFSSLWRNLAGQRKTLTFSLGGNADVTARSIWLGDAWSVEAATPLGSISFHLRVAGKHNVKNALAAICCAIAAGVPMTAIANGLESFEPVKGRSRAFLLSCSECKTTLIDDTYNANPDSVRAAIDMLAELPGPHLLVLGDMGEVGDQGPEFHAEVGEYAVERGIEHLMCSGELMRYCAASFPNARHIGGVNFLADAVITQLPQFRSILVKGSRFMRMERVISMVLENSVWNIKETINAH